MTGHELLSFMKAYFGYNQIKIHPPDENKIAFIIGRGIYYYKLMPFGLKNAEATFQRVVDKVFKDLFGSTMEVYIDDMVKNVLHKDHLQYLGEAFNLVRKCKVKLNPEKCTFGVASEKFLGYLVTQCGIKADPDQIFAILNIKSSTCVKEVQMLNSHSEPIHQLIHGQVAHFQNR